MKGRGFVKTVYRVVILLVSVLLVGALPAHADLLAQGAGPLVAFPNSSGQLVISSGDGSYRWIVTNPGETLALPLGYSWSPNGQRLFFALGGGGAVSLRVADAASQSIGEFGIVSGAGSVTGGYWSPDGGAVIIGADNRVLSYPVSGGGPVELVVAAQPVPLQSPLGPGSDRPNLAQAGNVGPSGQVLFYPQGGGNVVQALGAAPIPAPGGDPTGPFSGLWADGAPLVAYSGFNGNSTLSVTNAATGATVTLDSGRTAPINPLAWRPGTLHLIYRDATASIRMADLSCLTSACSGNPLDTGLELIPASATDVQTDGTWVYYVDGGAVKATPLNCAGTGSCAGSTATLGTNVAPQTMMHVEGLTLAYTGTNDPYNPADRDVRVVDLRCLGNPASCQAQLAATGASSGLVSPDGQYVIIEGVNGGLNALRLFDGLLTSLSDSNPAGQSLLALARWS